MDQGRIADLSSLEPCARVVNTIPHAAKLCTPQTPHRILHGGRYRPRMKPLVQSVAEAGMPAVPITDMSNIG